MNTYAIVVTAMLFFVIGYIVAIGQEEMIESRNVRSRRRQVTEPQMSRPEDRSNFADDTDAAMDEAVALVKNELGGTVIETSRNRVGF